MNRKHLYLKLLFESVGLHGANFQVTSSDFDNEVLSAMLRVLADEICEKPSEKATENAKKFVALCGLRAKIHRNQS